MRSNMGCYEEMYPILQCCGEDKLPASDPEISVPEIQRLFGGRPGNQQKQWCLPMFFNVRNVQDQ